MFKILIALTLTLWENEELIFLEVVMLFETYINENGKKQVKTELYNEDSNYAYDVIDKKFFENASPDIISSMNIINDYIKKELLKNMRNFEGSFIPDENKEFSNIDFKRIFSDIMSVCQSSFEKTFYIENNKLINLHDGVELTIDNENNKIVVNILPGYDFFWENKKEEIENRVSRRKKNEFVYDMNNHVNLIPYSFIGVNFKNQYLSYVNSLLNNENYELDEKLLISDCLQYVNKDGCLFNINNLDEFINELLLIKNHYSDRLSHPKSLEKDYILTNKKLETIKKGDIFSFFVDRMSSLFYYSYNKKDKLNISILSSIDNYNPLLAEKESRIRLNDNIPVSLDRIEELEKILNIHERINKHFDAMRYLFSHSDTYLLDRDRSYDKYEKNHQINKISYNDFLKYYDLMDYPVNKCLFEFISAYMSFDEMLKEYIGDTIRKFVSNNEKLNLIINDNQMMEYDYSSKDIKELNENLKLPYNAIKILYSPLTCNEIKLLYKIAESLHENKKELEEYDFSNDNVNNLLEEIYYNSVKLNKSKLFFERIKDNALINGSNEKIMMFIKIIEKNLNEQNKSLKGAINLKKLREKIEKDSVSHSIIRNSSFQMEFAKEEKEDFNRNMTLEELIEYVSEAILYPLMGQGNKEENMLFSHIEWIILNLDINKQDLFVKIKEDRIPVFDDKKSYKFNFFGGREIILNLLDYHLIMGNNEVIYYLKEQGLQPILIKNQEISSLEYAILGVCDNKIIDWICNKLNVLENFPVKVFGFLAFRIYSSHDTILSNRLMVNENDLHSSDSVSLFSQNKEKIYDEKVLNKMKYVYSKYKVNFNFYLNRLHYLINSNNQSLIENELGLNKEIINKIIYGIYIKNLLINNDVINFEKEVKQGKLSFYTDLRNNLDKNEDDIEYQSGILTYLDAFYEKFKYHRGFDSENKFENYINILLQYITTNEKVNLKSQKTTDNLNLFELIMKNGVRKYENLIRKLAMEDYYGFDLTSGKRASQIESRGFIGVDEEEEFEIKSYKELYFNSGDYERTLFDKMVSDIEKFKIQKSIEGNKDTTVKKRRM